MYSKILPIFLCYGRITAAVLHRQADEAVPVSVSPTLPSGAPQVASDFAGFAFEERSFYYYFGTPDKPNNFSLNLVEAITSRTKTVPNIRVGGTSLDDSQYDRNLDRPIYVDPKEEGQGIPSNMTFGPLYFKAFATVPNAKYVIDIPFKKNKLNNSENFAKDAYKKIGAKNIIALEIGNEPNNYGKTREEYTKQWGDWSGQISQTLGMKQDEKIYQAICLGSETGDTKFPGGEPGDWKIPDVFEKGLKKFQNRIKTVSMHYYQTKAHNHSNLQHDLMNHTAVVKGSQFVKDAIHYLNNNLASPIPLALAEVGNTLGNSSNNDALENVLGSALWQADFFLYSMSIGVQRINLQSGLTFGFALWNPKFTAGDKTTPASVHASFYGQMFSADFIGDSGNVRVANIDLGRPFLSAYVAYDGDKPARLAVCNLELCSGLKDCKQKPGKKITLDLGNGIKSVEVRRLTSVQGGTAGPGNITWSGMQWTAESNGKAVQVLKDTVTLPVREGKVDVNVGASEAVMVFLKS